jgi:hypothetical protein
MWKRVKSKKILTFNFMNKNIIIISALVMLVTPLFTGSNGDNVQFVKAQSVAIVADAKEPTKINPITGVVHFLTGDQKELHTGDIAGARMLRSNGYIVKASVLDPLREAVKTGRISRHTAVMIASLHIIESPGAGWSAIGCDVTQGGCVKGYGRFGVGLTQVMSYPEMATANANMGTNWTVQEVLQDPSKQIDIIVGLMIQKQKSLDENYNPDQMHFLAGQWLGYGCDMHGTCSTEYADLSRENYIYLYDKL